MVTREMAVADGNVSRQRRCDRAMAMVLRARDGDTSDKQAYSKGTQAGNEDACNSN
jgi:hypothetical protein